MIHNESQNKIKTLIFSELPKQNKIKYFELLLENDIKFSKDTKGNYVALVKLLNPSFYNEDKNNINTSKNNISKIRCKSAINHREIIYNVIKYGMNNVIQNLIEKKRKERNESI